MLLHQAMIVSGAVPPIIVLANSGSFETKTQCMSILQRMLLGRAMPDEVSTLLATAALFSLQRARELERLCIRRGEEKEATQRPEGRTFATLEWVPPLLADFYSTRLELPNLGGIVD